jgi:hypothetical protein
MTEGMPGVREFLSDESGAIYGATSYMTATMAISIPLGLILYAVYDALCDAGRYANFVIGLF